MSKDFRNKLLVPILFLFLLVILSACGGGAAPEEPAAPAEPAAPEAPAEPVQPSEQYPVLYGQDSRTELFQHTDAELQKMAASVAIFVHTSQVKISKNTVTLDGFTLDEMSEMGWLVKDSNLPMCSGELFASQTAPGFCTGFLVKDDILVTAGHCLEKTPCSDTSIVFGFSMESDTSLAALTTENIFKCEDVIAQVSPNPDNSYLDYAIIKLDRPAGRAGLRYANVNLIQPQDTVAVIGHPSGLPLKIASNAFVMGNEASQPFFSANLDTFGSNSGSPVINTNTYQVEGILVRGMADYVLSGDGSCVQVNRCPESGGTDCAGENATKMERLAEFIPESTDTEGLICFPSLFLVLVFIAMVRLKST